MMPPRKTTATQPCSQTSRNTIQLQGYPRMKKIIYTILLLLFLASCQAYFADEKLKETDQSAIKELLSDPDPSDTVAAGEYLVESADQATASLIAVRLRHLYQEDISNNWIDSTARRFIQHAFDLNNDQKNELFVGFTGPYFCGSGGCNILLLSAEGELITEFTVVDYPMVIDTETTGGWRNLLIFSNGDWHVLKHNGNAYPPNPSVQPALGMAPQEGLPRLLDFINKPYPWFRF